jgi:hypothetical protein
MRDRIAAVFIVLASVAPGLPAQTVERPVAFDSAGRVMTITPPLAARLQLAAPLWPVTGDFVEARLFDRGNDTFVVAVQRAQGAIERYELSAAARESLRSAVTTAMRRTGSLTTGERPDEISQPAKGRLVRDQVVLSLVLYGPALAALTHDATAGGALYLASVGATFFTAAQIAKNRPVSKAQNHMATNGAWRGALIARGLLYVAQGGHDPSTDATAAALLVGGIGGTILGFHAGRALTDGEAHGATVGSTLAALTTTGIIGAVGGFEHASAGVARPFGTARRYPAQVAAITGAALVGFPLGLHHVRRAPYSITAGDAAVLTASYAVGVLGASTFLVDGDPSDQAVAAVLTTGLLAGAVIGEMALVKPYDFTESQGWLMQLGAAAGGLMGVAIPVAAKSESAALNVGAAALGAVAGLAITRSLLDPARSAQRESPNAGATASRGAAKPGVVSRVAVALHPEGLAILLARPGANVTVRLLNARW